MTCVSVWVTSHLIVLLHILPSCRSDRNCVDDGARPTFYVLFIFYHRAVPSAVASMMVHVPPFTICWPFLPAMLLERSEGRRLPIQIILAYLLS